MSGMFKKSKSFQLAEIAGAVADDFLVPLSQKAASPDVIAKHASEILKQSGVTLNDLVTKCAQQYDLNPEEVCRVVEESNKEVFDRLFKLSSDKAVEFDVADPREVFKKTDIAYDPGFDMFFQLEHPREKMAKQAAAPEVEGPKASWAASALRPTPIQKAAILLDQAKQAEEVLKELKFDASAEALAAASGVYKIAKQMVLKKEATPDEILCAVGEARKWGRDHLAGAYPILQAVADATGTSLSPLHEVHKTAADLGYGPIGEGIGKQFDPLGDYQPQADVSSPPHRVEELINGDQWSGDRPVKVINGNHKLFMLLDTLVDQTHKDKVFEKGTLIAGDEVRYAKRGIVNWKKKTEAI